MFGTPLGGRVNFRECRINAHGHLPSGDWPVGLVLAASVLGCSTFLGEVDTFQRGWRTLAPLDSSTAQLRGGAMTDC
jgi:hypothetical protein